jgi:molecular chaperone DnaK (HSP70)
VAKNDFEGMIYKFRDWLREDENEPYIKEDKREELLSELSEHESWLDDATDEIGYKVYEDKFKNLSK